MKYYAVYKCPLCGQLFRITNGTVECEENDLPVLMAKIVQNHELFFGNQYLYKCPIYMPHKCNDGNGGLGQLAGFKQEGTPLRPYEEPKRGLLRRLLGGKP